MLKTHDGPYDIKTMKAKIQLKFQCDADLGGNPDNGHSQTSYLDFLAGSLCVALTQEESQHLQPISKLSSLSFHNQLQFIYRSVCNIYRLIPRVSTAVIKPFVYCAIIKRENLLIISLKLRNFFCITAVFKRLRRHP